VLFESIKDSTFSIVVYQGELVGLLWNLFVVYEIRHVFEKDNIKKRKSKGTRT
jgi:hypothetical protein